MKIFISIIYLIAFTFLSCVFQKNKDLDEIIITPKENIKNILDSFIVANPCDSCIYELFIDKLSPNIFNLLITKGTQKLTAEENAFFNQNPLLVTYVSGIKFYIYSGVEYYFYADTISSNKKQTSLYDYERTKWIVTDTLGTITINSKVNMAYPFIPSTYRNSIIFSKESEIKE
ncbi:MAG: hypothetical protein LBB85_01405 [Dysgonamonadaceae bacterium]|jgi:hypothetical protein|nr:hypothetical protein [Dysgonamonadaceae bacterium]